MKAEPLKGSAVRALESTTARRPIGAASVEAAPGAACEPDPSLSARVRRLARRHLRGPVRRFWRRIAYQALRTVALRSSALGPAGVARMAARVGAFLYWLRPVDTWRDLRNLAGALPETAPAQRRQILRASLRNAATVGMEAVQLMAEERDAGELLARVHSADLDALDAALARGRGAVVVSAHIGNFTVVPMYLARQGHAVHLIFREGHYVPRGLYSRRLRELGVTPIDADGGQAVARELLAALRAGGVVVIYLDQGMKPGRGLMVDFLGKRVAMPDGPVVLARRTGAPVLAAFYEPPRHHLAVLGPLAVGHQGDALDDDVQQLATLAEAEVRAWPEHWAWRYRRWARARF